jgi:hypothetical protein
VLMKCAAAEILSLVVRLSVLLVVLVSMALISSARADNFSSVRYDPKTNEIVAQMSYRGTNANHAFSLRWGKCMDREDGSGKEISADVIDDQWDDAALHDYGRTARFSLAGVTCRPARVTLRSPPRFYFTIFVPGVPVAHVVAHAPGCRPGYRLRGGSTCIPAVVLQDDRSESAPDSPTR